MSINRKQKSERIAGSIYSNGDIHEFPEQNRLLPVKSGIGRELRATKQAES
jgi:protoporphyrinogen oxidase